MVTFGTIEIIRVESIKKDGHGYICILRTKCIFPVKIIEEKYDIKVIRFSKIKERQG